MNGITRQLGTVAGISATSVYTTIQYRSTGSGKVCATRASSVKTCAPGARDQQNAQYSSASSSSFVSARSGIAAKKTRTKKQRTSVAIARASALNANTSQ